MGDWVWDNPLAHDEMYHSRGYTIYALYKRHTVIDIDGCEWMAASYDNRLPHTLCTSKQEAIEVSSRTT